MECVLISNLCYFEDSLNSISSDFYMEQLLKDNEDQILSFLPLAN